MNSAKGYRKGAFRVICDVCGFKKWSYQTRMRWDGMRVCNEDWEPRHPQDFLAVPADKQTVPNPRPDTDPSFRTLYQWDDDTKTYSEV